MIRRLFSLILMLLLPLSACAGFTYDQLEKVTVSPAHLDGHFTQEKYLSALDASLVSTGVFSYQRGRSIRWETLEPIKNELLMTPESIINRQGGQELLQLETASNPVVKVLSEIFFAVLTADWAKLSGYFDLSGTLEGSQWTAELVPTDSAVRQVVTRVELKGDSLLREVVLHENGGNRTAIRFDSLSR
ncbi:outer membrane lipoprotein carrier protein LolA [Marinobacterium arenosum]|uniref:outer membrane lipoprotein carrier protein LolA n=1 Tax=Marinobacterium arenosum TaxID=2862496 RepID=UPI001C946641|nr:outer membrane lipoprotein carrier protein LolA [Marinobacterium arenosum]MBY4676116.1 outer membrane lipoprotein carrier protein LolA [Marinobacterium arenosum]